MPRCTLFWHGSIFLAIYAYTGGGGVAKRWHDDKGEGGGLDTPQKWWRHLWTAPKNHIVDLKNWPQSMQKRRQYKDLKTWQPHPCTGVCILGNKFQNYNSWKYLLQKAIPTNLNKFGLISSQKGIEGCQGSQNMFYSSVELKLLRWLLNWFFFWWASTCSTSKFGCTSCKEIILSKLGQISYINRDKYIESKYEQICY